MIQQEVEKTPQWALDIIRDAQERRLTELNLRGHKQAEKLKFVPHVLFKLTNLQSLYLSGNRLTSIPEDMTKLVNLKDLNLSFNKITVVPNWLVNLPQINRLFLYDNPIRIPPPELLNLKPGHPVNLEMLRAYFRQQSESGEESLYEAKLIIVGEPGAGKTSLTRKLIFPAASLPTKVESTEGIDVRTWSFHLSEIDRSMMDKSLSSNDKLASGDKSLSSDERQFQVNIWDFGGQEIYHATHQFFLTRRSLYIIVADAREQKTDFFYWLDLIEHLSNNSPVLIFNNEFQNRHWAINEQQLKAHFPESFHKPFAFNLAYDLDGLAHLRRKIQEQITQLPHVGDVLPRTWINVRRALENAERAILTVQAFVEICQDNGFTRREDALQLSGYLHDLGVILHFQDDPLLKGIVILRPEWGTDAVYRVLDNDQVKANLGHFNLNDLYNIWHENQYIWLHDQLLALMMKFQLCYAIPGQRESYIAPQLLSDQPPSYEWDREYNLYLRYKYEAFMPKGLISRFIVAMHPNIVTEMGKQLVWRSGVVLEKDDTRAEVVEFYHRREIQICISGKNPRDLLTIIIYELDKLHVPFHSLQFNKLIPCNCITCQGAEKPNFYRLDVLKTRLEHSKEDIECDRPPFEIVKIRELLDAVGGAMETTDLPTMLRMLNRVFNAEEFSVLCLEMRVNFDNLPGEALEGKQRELLLLLERNNRLPELINLLRQKRPNFNW